MSPIFPCSRPTAERELAALRRDLDATDLEHAAITVRRAQIEDEIYAIERVLAIADPVTADGSGAILDRRLQAMVAECDSCRAGQDNTPKVSP